MRILPTYPSQEGYEPLAPELNQEEGILEITHPSECTLREEKKLAPKFLVLRCALRPLPIADKTIKVQLISEGEKLEKVPLYESESITYGYEWEVRNTLYQGISLEYAGMGHGTHQGEAFVIEGNVLPSGALKIDKPLYVKPFRVETQDYQERSTTLPSERVLTTPPGVLDTRVLRGYGGHYKVGIDLEEIQQVYYSLTFAKTQTRVRLHSTSALKESLTPPPLGGHDFNQDVLFHPVPREEDYLSLSGAIAAGYVRFSVTMEWGDISFRSFQSEPVSGNLGHINVYFKP